VRRRLPQRTVPRPAETPAHAGQLGGFDKDEFLKGSPDKPDLARHLDLSDRANIPDHGYCGGVVIDPAGLVLVNFHAIEGATKVYVHLPGGKGSYADIHAADGRSDLAVLKLLSPVEGLKPIKFGEVLVNDTPKRTVFPGKLTVLMVNPYVTGFVLGRPSGSLGSLTNIRRRPAEDPNDTVYRSVYLYGLLLEHDVKLNAGCSGGALLNLDGELIGLTTTIAAATGAELGPGYALPIDPNTRKVIDVLRRGEEVEYGFVGIALRRGTRAPIVIGSVTKYSPAAEARLQPDDIVTQINGNPAGNYEDLLLYLGSSLAGSKVRLTYRRGRDVREAEVTLAKFRNESPSIASVRPEPVFGLRVDYGSILAQQLGQNPFPRFNDPGVPPGVIVRDLLPDSPAAAKFKALGDNSRWLITRVNDTETPTPADFYKAARGQQSIKLTVIDPTEVPHRPREVTLP
jgi:serine protease Do